MTLEDLAETTTAKLLIGGAETPPRARSGGSEAAMNRLAKKRQSLVAIRNPCCISYLHIVLYKFYEQGYKLFYSFYNMYIEYIIFHIVLYKGKKLAIEFQNKSNTHDIYF